MDFVLSLFVSSAAEISNMLFVESGSGCCQQHTLSCSGSKQPSSANAVSFV